jgi:hypothetical protein
MRNIKKKMQIGGRKRGEFGVVFCIFNYGKNVAKTTFDRRIRNDGGTGKKNYYNIVYGI